MHFINIHQTSEQVSLREAVLRSITQESGLYMPASLPVLPENFFKALPSLSLPEIALEVSRALLSEDVPVSDLRKICEQALDFPIPLKTLDETIHVLELFHGPTLAFKDVGARFMAGLFSYFLQQQQQEVTILVATSGDTGSAVAHAFYQKPGIRVCVLYPSGKVSALQEKQLTTMGGNIKALEVQGSFDDCQQLVKQAFADAELNHQINLTSANSINFARLFPQSFYYFYAMAQLKAQHRQHKPVYISVPSGNFGNLCAGLIAKKMGLPVSKFIAATNSNHAVPDYLKQGIYETHPVKYTISNAMDVAKPSNFPRMLWLYQQSHAALSNDVLGTWCTDDETRSYMRTLFDRYAYVADPHGAIAYAGLQQHLPEGARGIFLESAHPAKFPDAVSQVIQQEVSIPDSLQTLMQQQKQAVLVPADYTTLVQQLLTP